jgi:PKHD-type hydroxylase
MINNKHSYWYFTSALTKEFCENVIQCGLSKQSEVATIGGVPKKDKYSKEDIKKIKKYRYSDIVWLNEPWIYQEILPYVKVANNESSWGYEWHETETAQFTIYKKNQFYKWHQDSGKEEPNSKTIRKLSVTVSLSDPKDYKGGLLEIDNRRMDTKSKFLVKEGLPQGSIIVFPSYMWHRVTPVTKGTRYSLVIWNKGFDFI